MAGIRGKVKPRSNHKYVEMCKQRLIKLNSIATAWAYEASLPEQLASQKVTVCHAKLNARKNT